MPTWRVSAESGCQRTYRSDRRSRDGADLAEVLVGGREADAERLGEEPSSRRRPAPRAGTCSRRSRNCSEQAASRSRRSRRTWADQSKSSSRQAARSRPGAGTAPSARGRGGSPRRRGRSAGSQRSRAPRGGRGRCARQGVEHPGFGPLAGRSTTRDNDYLSRVGRSRDLTPPTTRRAPCRSAPSPTRHRCQHPPPRPRFRRRSSYQTPCRPAARSPALRSPSR